MQLDEKWAFVYQKEKHRDADDPYSGDNWDHVAFDPEHQLVLSLVTGKRTKAQVNELVSDFRRRTRGRPMRLITSDEYKPYKDALLRAYGEKKPPRRRSRGDRKPPPRREPLQDLLYVVIHKHRRKGRVVRVTTRVVFGTKKQLAAALEASPCSRRANIALVERYKATDRHHTSRKVRKSYRFSKDWDLHEAASWFATGTYNFCWPVRTQRRKRPDGTYQARTPAMSAGLTDQVWELKEWLSPPVPFQLVA